jgi:hypothetical protein
MKDDAFLTRDDALWMADGDVRSAQGVMGSCVRKGACVEGGLIAEVFLTPCPSPKREGGKDEWGLRGVLGIGEDMGEVLYGEGKKCE